MLLAVDVGNTHTVAGLFAGDTLRAHWRLTTATARTADEIALLYRMLLDAEGVRLDSIQDVAVCSVVPPATAEYRNLGGTLFACDPLIIDSRAVPWLRILNHDPATVGADRLVNAVAATEQYGTPAIVVDLGTATTLDVVDADGAYAGGVIAPGVLSSAQALFRQGARLARVEVRDPGRVVGRNTEESIQAGVFYGAVGAVDSLVERIREEMAFPPELPVVATGGLAAAVAARSRSITAVDDTLTLRGIRIVHRRNRQPPD